MNKAILELWRYSMTLRLESLRTTANPKLAHNRSYP
jgi:hypothetical protein